MLRFQLFGCTRDSGRKLSKDFVLSEHGVQAIVAAVHRRDPQSVLSSVYTADISAVSARRVDNELLWAVEARLEADVSRFL